mgnify:CR=1 FL=1
MEDKNLTKRIFGDIYNDIANYRVLNKEQLENISKLSQEQQIKLIKLYNDIIISLYQGNLFE